MVAGSQSKRREKYARREDAIVDAIELEKEQMEIEEEEELKTLSAGGTSGKKSSSRQKGKQNGEQTKKGGRASKKGGGLATKAAQGGGGSGEKEKDCEAPAPAPAQPPRMRGLQDLVSAGTSSKISSIEGLEGSSEVDEKPGRSMKRKRTAGNRAGEEPLLPASKRRDKKRAIAQVLETTDSQRENGGGDEPAAAVVGSEKVKAEVCNGGGEDKLSDDCESTQDAMVMNPEAPPAPAPEKDPQVVDAHSASSGALAPPSSDGGAMPSLASSPSALLQEKVQEKAQENAQVKKEKVMSRRKKAPLAPRTLASRIETRGSAGAGAETPAPKEENPKPPEPEEQQQEAAAAVEQKPTASRVEPSTVVSDNEKTENEETVTACSPSPKSEEQKEATTFREGFTGPCHPRTRFEKQPVAVVPLYSSVIRNPVHGYPVSVEVVKSIGPLWQASRRPSRYRAASSSSGYELPASSYEEEYYYGVKVPGTGKAPRKSKEALSKKLLKRAVLTSKKIRTLASISEERGRQPFSELLSSEIPPRWPVATLVPVSVALNRLRTIVCS